MHEAKDWLSGLHYGQGWSISQIVLIKRYNLILLTRIFFHTFNILCIIDPHTSWNAYLILDLTLLVPLFPLFMLS